MPRSNALQQLVKAGQLRIGTTLYHEGRLHRERSVEATVEAGGIRVGDRVYPSPSTAAVAIAGHPTNGWTFWRLRGTGQTLQELRPGK